MPDLSIEKKNETFLVLTGEQHILQELDDIYTFYADGFKYHRLYKQKVWDGRIHLLKRKTKTCAEIYCGLLSEILKFCREKNYSVDYVNDKVNIPDEEILNFIKTLNLSSKGNPIELRDYQVKGIIDGIKNKRQLLLSVTSSGKSAILYTIIRYLLHNDYRVLLLVPNVSLVHQMVADFIDYSSLNEFNCDENIHVLYSGQEKLSNKPLYISTWQNFSAYLRNPHTNQEAKEVLSLFDAVLGDEAHLVKGIELSKIFELCDNASYKIGTTGTLSNCLANIKQIVGLTGTINKLNSAKELMNKGQISNIKIKCLLLKYDEIIAKSIKNFTYQNEIKFLVSNQQRNVFIKNLALSMKNNTIILCNYIEHMKILHELISKSSHIGDRKVYLIYGAIEAERREEIRNLIETEKNSIIIGSSQIMGTGISIKSLHNIIFASGGKSKIRTLQSIGRALRLHESKNCATLYDICDDLSYKRHKNFSLLHFIERVKMYNQEQFDYKIINIKF